MTAPRLAIDLDRTIPDPVIEPTITAGRLAAILGVSVRTVHNGVDRDEIPHVRVGRRVLILTGKALTKFELLPDTAKAGSPHPASATFTDESAALNNERNSDADRSTGPHSTHHTFDAASTHRRTARSGLRTAG